MTRKKRFWSAVSIVFGTCVGAGVLGLPYVASKAGFFVSVGYIIVLGFIILLSNLYLGEISLRTKKTHQIAGYVDKYLGRKGMYLMEFATVFGIYAALIAYMMGVGESFSFIVFGNGSYTTELGVLFGIFMAVLIRDGIKGLKKYELLGVSVVVVLLLAIFVFFIGDVRTENLMIFDSSFIFLPFGVVIFALLSFHSIPEVRIVLKNNEKLFRKSLITGTVMSIIFYIVFIFVVTGSQGEGTPQVATLALGSVFVFLGILTMFTSYLAMGNALFENLIYDETFKRQDSWVLSSVVPIGVFLLIQTFDVFSFTGVLSIGGVISGGLTAILILFTVKVSKKKGNRKPEFQIPINWVLLMFLSLIFIFGVVSQLF